MPSLALTLFSLSLCLGWCIKCEGQNNAVNQVEGEKEGTSKKAPANLLRPRELGIHIGILSPGTHNAITDVKGVLVGHQTLSQGENIRTGVTVIKPHGDNLFRQKVPAAIYVGNGFGKLAGSTQVKELGNIETPIALTNTLSVSTGVKALVRHAIEQKGNEDVRSVNAVVGETNDGYLNDIRGMHVKESDFHAAIKNAKSGKVDEGNVGAGTGTMCFGFKGGIGTSSRQLPKELGGYTVGVLVQSNFGGVLTINGAPVGRELGKFSFKQFAESKQDGSCMIVVATDAPLSDRNLQRLAKRALFGMARTGSIMSNGSGDYVIAFSTGYRITGQGNAPKVDLLPNQRMTPLFLAVAEATEEAIINSLFAANKMTGRQGNQADALPRTKTVEILKKYQLLNLGQRLPSIRR